MTSTEPDLRKLRRIRAPDLPADLPWLNVPGPLSLADLAGRFVLLDFWTYCCINCLHVLPELQRLEEEFPEELVVVGVHSAKFENEGDTERIREAIQRHDIGHPVVNDRHMEHWQQHGIRAWPSVRLIDPEGYIVAAHSGEGVHEPISRLMTALIPVYEGRGTLRRQPGLPALERAATWTPGLRFPGKLLAHDGRLFIADSGHHRVIVAGPDGRVLKVIGTGSAGSEDGAFEAASFRYPQGMAARDGEVFVCDTDNHLLRRIDLARETVETVAGTGVKNFAPHARGVGREVPLNSPWDACFVGDDLYLAMAGNHQIWLFRPGSGEIGAAAGSGREARIDGDRAEAAFAQPSGLATDGRFLYVADSEISAIRRIDLAERAVTTLAGGDLFEFGLVDGTGDEARFQHPLDVEFADGVLWVADTFNHALRAVDPETREVTTVVGRRAQATLRGDGRGVSGFVDGSSDEASFNEPAGLALLGGVLLVADQNNHAVRAFVREGRQVGTLKLKGLPNVSLAPVQQRLVVHADVAAGKGFGLELELPDGDALNTAAPSEWRLLRGGAVAGQGSIPSVRFELEGGAILEGDEIELDVYTCSAERGTCRRTALLVRDLALGLARVRVPDP